MALTPIQHFKGAKNKHPTTLCQCDCGKERIVRTTRFRLGIVTMCATCAKSAGAVRGGLVRRLPAEILRNREIYGQYLGNARRRSIDFRLSLDQVVALIRSSCHYCGATGTPTNGIDRRNNNDGYTVENAVSCCSICNYAKRDMSAEQFLLWVQRIHDHQSLLQRDRSVLLRVAKQPDGRGAHNAGGDL